MEPQDRTEGFEVGDVVEWTFRPSDLWEVEEVRPPWHLKLALSWGELGTERHFVEAGKCRVYVPKSERKPENAGLG